MSHAMKLLKLPYFSPVVFSAQQLLHPNNPNAKFIPITLPFSIHISCVIIKIYYGRHVFRHDLISNTNSKNVSKVGFLMFGHFIYIFLHFGRANAVLAMPSINLYRFRGTILHSKNKLDSNAIHGANGILVLIHLNDKHIVISYCIC